MYIREANIEDFEQLMVFYTEMNEVINKRTEKYNPDNPIFPAAQMVEEAITSHGQFVVIDEDSIVAACIVNNKCDYDYKLIKWGINAREDEFWVVHALRVLPEYEGRGIAKRLMAFLIELAPERGQKALRLDVLDGYTVDRFYYQFGFEYIDTTAIFYEDIGKPMNFKLFEKIIDGERNEESKQI